MTYGVTTHAVRRYVERVKPQLGETQARRELYALLEFGAPVARPLWDLGHQGADAWLEIAPDCVALVKDGAIVTVITRDLAVEPARRKQRQIERRRRRSKRWKGGRALRGHGHGRPQARIEDEVWPV